MYVFSGGGHAELDRLKLLESEYDEITFQKLMQIGVGAGWHCLDLGAGAGSVACWLADHVGCDGHVVAADVDTKHLGRYKRANIEVLEFDFQTDSLDGMEFDLVHARMLLSHLENGASLVTRLAKWCRPGGWVVIGDVDKCSSHVLEASAVFKRVWSEMQNVLKCRGFQPDLGRKLPGLLHDSHLVDIGASGSVKFTLGGSVKPQHQMYDRMIRRMTDEIVASGAISRREVEVALAELAKGTVAMMGSVFVIAYGRRPDNYAADLIGKDFNFSRSTG